MKFTLQIPEEDIYSMLVRTVKEDPATFAQHIAEVQRLYKATEDWGIRQACMYVFYVHLSTHVPTINSVILEIIEKCINRMRLFPEDAGDEEEFWLMSVGFLAMYYREDHELQKADAQLISLIESVASQRILGTEIRVAAIQFLHSVFGAYKTQLFNSLVSQTENWDAIEEEYLSLYAQPIRDRIEGLVEQ